MKTKRLASAPLPLLLTTALLSMGLLVSACSDNTADDGMADNNATATQGASASPSSDTENQNAASTDENLAPTTSEPTVADTNSLVEENTESEANITSDNINPVTNNEQPSLVTNPILQEDTPEATVEQALNTLYYGDVKDAIDYYEVDMVNFEDELANTQSAFQQTVDSVTLIDTKYNEDKTRATINGEIMLKGQSEPAPLTYELQKIDGQWKILG